MISSRLTTKGQTTIPQPVRVALRLKEGDEIHYAIDGHRVIMTPAQTEGDPFAVFTEWSGDADREAYAKL